MSLHINPVSVLQNGTGIVVAPEAMILYPEGSDEFEYIRGLIGDWEYYVSHVAALPDAVATVSVQVDGVAEETESQCSAYIYGWMPGAAEWIEGSCVAVVCFGMPKVVVSEAPLSVTILIRVEGDVLVFNSKRIVPIYYEVQEETAE